MKKFLVVYVSRTGKTKQMAEWIAEGLRFAGHDAALRTLPQVKKVEDIAGYDGYVLGSPTYHRAMIEGFNSWLFKAQRAGVQGKIGGAFGSHTHSGEAPGILQDTMEHVFKMDMAGLGPLRMEERVVVTDDGMHACQQFGRALGERAGA
ncbi:MAG: flavodoxin domain-containing protein [Deferrisomatales bacterium]|nr:flavodoxin domain-containing protein [Deferrisomatales bacterium]